MNPIGVHANTFVPDWSNESATKAITMAKSAGFDLIEIPMFEPHNVDPVHTRTVLADNGLGVSASLGLSPATDVTSADPAIRAAGRALLSAAVDRTAEVGGHYLVGVLYSTLGRYAEPATPADRERAVESVQWLADYATAAGLEIGLEIVNRYETNIANTAREMVSFIGQTGRPVGIHIDSYHMNIEEDGYFQPFLDGAQYINYVHIGESNRGYLGTGTIDFPQVFAGMRAIGFTGPVTFESFSSVVVNPSLSNTLSIWRNLWSDSANLAAHARAFIAAHLGAWEDPRS